MNGQHNENGPTSRGNDNAGPGQRLDQEGEALMGNIQAAPTDSPFEPGDGWREVDQDEWYQASQPTLALERGKNDEHARYWVREGPVPALPTEQYTIIWATWPNEASDAVVLTADGWQFLAAPSMTVDLNNITSFEVVSEPRAVTAKAVLDEVRETIGGHMDYIDPAVLDEVGDEFGVES